MKVKLPVGAGVLVVFSLLLLSNHGSAGADTPTPPPPSSLIKVQKTEGDTFNAPGWIFTPTVSGGASVPASGVTDGGGQVSFAISIGAATATVSLAETPGSPPLFSASCFGATANGAFDGIDSVDGIVVSPGDTVTCYFQNGLPGPPTPCCSPTPIPIGGTVGLTVTSSGSGVPWVALAGFAAGVIALFGAGLWYGRRRWSR